MSPNARHSSETDEHYTPAPIVDAARDALGGTIDLDPASCVAANRIVRAERIHSRVDNGLAQEWRGRVFCNPPGGKTDGRSNQKIWWGKLVNEYLHGRVSAAVFLSFSIELLQTSQVHATGPTPHDYTICFPSRRIAYTREDGSKGASPPHASMLIYLGPDHSRFIVTTRGIGRCMGPR